MRRLSPTVWLAALLVLAAPGIAFAQVDDEEQPEPGVGDDRNKAPEDEPEKQKDREPLPPPVEPSSKVPATTGESPLPNEQTRSAEDFEGAPLPTEASGTIVPRNKGASFGRNVGRVLLFVPRWTAEALFAPVRLGLWTYNRFQLGDRFQSIFFNDEGTLGLFPVAFFETGFGLNVGARFIWRELFKGDGKLQARLSYGGRFRQVYSAKLKSGRLLGGRLEMELDGSFQIFRRSRFFGIGNEVDFTGFDAGDPLIDPINDDSAVKTRYRHDDALVKLTADVRLVGALSLRLSGGFLNRDFDDLGIETRGDQRIFEVYDRNQLVGFNDGQAAVVPEIELVYDTRRRTSPFRSAATPATGWKLAGFVGWHKAVENSDPSDFFLYGIDLQRHINLFNGDRFLILRAYLEGVTGNIEEIPFADLPRLGGPTFLRGYDRDRFRDRIATLYTAEYNYPMAGNLSAFLFTDTGRVYRDYDSVTDQGFDDLHVGFGMGIQGHTRNSFITRATVYSSIDGDLFFSVSFDPVFDTRSREETP